MFYDMESISVMLILFLYIVNAKSQVMELTFRIMKANLAMDYIMLI